MKVVNLNVSRNLFLSVLVLMQVSCAHISNQANIDSRISWHSIKKAAHESSTSKHTWIPLIDAAVFSIDDWDEKAVGWVSDSNPLFGNIKGGQRTSDQLSDLSKLNLLLALTMASAQADESLSEGFSRLTLTALAIDANARITNSIKSSRNRLRPDGSDNLSFPSGHSSGASSKSAIARYHIRQIDNLTTQQREFWQISNTTIAMLTGWARIEGEKHYPSDVFAGYALGNFVGSFFSQAFIKPLLDSNAHVALSVIPDEQIIIQVQFRW